MSGFRYRPFRTQPRRLSRMMLGRGFVANVPPLIVVPGAQSATSNVAKAITGTSLSDADGNTQTVTLTTNHSGTVSLASLTGLTGSGNGTNSISYSGTIAALNTALATLTYTSATDYAGSETISISTNDGAGGTDSDAIAITVTWTPQSESSLLAWFDESTGVKALSGMSEVDAVVDDPSYRWYARNNAAIYAESAALGNRPLKKSDHLLSDGLDDGMLIASGMLTAYRTGNSTLVVIFDRVEFGATKVISGMTSNHRTFRITSTDGAQALDGGAAVGAGSIAGTNTVMVASAFDVSNSKLKQSINAGAYTETAATINTTDSSISLFSRDGAGNLPIGIKGRHFLFFSSVLSTSSLSLLKTYFGL